MSIRQEEKVHINILLVDDHPENLLALEAVLSSPEYQVIKANSGQEALKWVLNEEFAVILMDVQMPGLDGFETARLIKQRNKSKEIPIIFITALSQASEHVQKGYAAGGMDYIFKPFEPSVLLKKVEGFVRIYKTFAEAKRQSLLLKQRTSELEEATLALRKAEALARAINDVSIDTVLVINSEGLIVKVNSAAKSMFGYCPENIVSKPASKLLPDLDQVLNNNNKKLIRTSAMKMDGNVFPAEVSIGQAIVDDQHLVVCSIRDITEREEIEQAREKQFELLEKLVQERTMEISEVNKKLRSSEQLFYKTFQLSPNIMVIRSLRDGRFIDVNESWVRVTGYRLEDVNALNLGFRNFKGVSLGDQSLTAFNAGKSLRNLRMTFIAKSGKNREGLLSTEILDLKGEKCLLSVITDVTEQLRFEKEMARLGRLDLIGEMAAGIAHEIRNPMTTVRGFLQMMSTRPEFQENREFFDLMISELDRANSIITEFLSLSKDQVLQLKKDNLNTLLETLFPLFQADAFNRKNDVRLELEQIPDLVFDQREVRQMILNLVRNGFEAMPHGGTLTLRTINKKREVILEIQDQGKGIEPFILEKLGDPFFTTKENGTGLGLSVCYRIAEKHNGRISVKTSSLGTTFSIHFPLTL
ncbi:response regulator [Desulfitobacterium sp. AusDCA]|uniref:response regulator n=1 Tax=Desulfitobacterium sp. AusDCA TaxID=3240383 RepID=UPI003DA77066